MIKDKSFNPTSLLLLIIVLITNTGESLQAQKRPLDIDACMSWNRIDVPSLSPGGQWVTYKITSIEFTENHKYQNSVFLYDTETGEEIILDNASDLQFMDNDKLLTYQYEHEEGKPETIIMDLNTLDKKVWKHDEKFNPYIGTSLSVVKDKDVADRLIIRNYKTEKFIQIDNIGYYKLFNKVKNILFVQKEKNGNSLRYGPLAGPYKTLYKGSEKGSPSFFRYDEQTDKGTFTIKDSLWYSFSIKKNYTSLLFDAQSIVLPDSMSQQGISMSYKHAFLTLELAPMKNEKDTPQADKEKKPDETFELELWTWNEYEVPTLQSSSKYRSRNLDKYIYNIQNNKLTHVAPSHATLIAPEGSTSPHFILYTDNSPYRMQKEWLDKIPFDIYAVNIHTGASQRIGKAYRDSPKWASNGKWAVMYDPIAQVWNKFDGSTGDIADISSDIGFPMHNEAFDKPSPTPAYGLAGWSDDGRYVYLMDTFDWWKIDLTSKNKTECFTHKYGRKHKKTIRKVISNFDKEVYKDNEKIMVVLYDINTKDEALYELNMKGRLKKLTGDDFKYTIHRFSDDQKYCIWSRQSTTEFRDLWWSKADFSNPVRITNANPQQKEYLWNKVELIEWTNYEDKPNKGLLYLPEDYNPEKEYPLVVQFYETHTEDKNLYRAPMLSSAMANVSYFVSNGYIMFLPDVHFTIGTPGQSSYDAIVSGVKHLIDLKIAHPGKIGLQGHSWSGYQSSYLVTKTDLFSCANIGAPITDMVSGYLGIRNGSGLPRYFMYEETQSRMGATLWNAKEKYLDSSVILEADKIKTPLLIMHNDNDEAVAYEQGRALYLAMRRLQRPSWLINYKNEGHFIINQEAQKDWTIRMMQFFDFYLKKTKQPRWMKEGIHLKERGIDYKYDFKK